MHSTMIIRNLLCIMTTLTVSVYLLNCIEDGDEVLGNFLDMLVHAYVHDQHKYTCVFSKHIRYFQKKSDLMAVRYFYKHILFYHVN